MLNYQSIFANTNGVAFPNTEAVNSSGGSATDGTEFVANMINDSMWGVWQALLNYTGQSPNGVVESNSSSQVLEALRRMDIPGKLIHVAWNDDPATLGIRALLLTGQGVLRANYPELDAVVYVGDTDNPTAPAYYHADDAAGTTRNTAGVYLILPDARGRVIRGLDLTGSVDPSGAARSLGDLQGFAFQGHKFHTFARDTKATTATVLSSEYPADANQPGGDNNMIVAGSSIVATVGLTSDPIESSYGAVSLSSETRMINLSANIAITY